MQRFRTSLLYEPVNVVELTQAAQLGELRLPRDVCALELLVVLLQRPVSFLRRQELSAQLPVGAGGCLVPAVRRVAQAR